MSSPDKMEPLAAHRESVAPSDGSAAAQAAAGGDAIASLGQVIGGCRLERLLGRGGMGEVHLAEHLGLGKKVAVKLHSDSFLSPDALDRFHQEARLAASIDHPNIIRVLHAGEQDGLRFMVLEYVDGESLEKRIERAGPLDAKEALDVAEQAARGLAAAHALGIVHRDIKPENLLLTRDGTVKIADFGIARGTFSAGGLTAAGQVLGTPYYMSPEQVEARPVDARTDLYGLGATLYYALSRTPPCTGETIQAIFSVILHSPPTRLSRIAPGVPPAVEALVMRLLEKDPAARLSTAEEVIEAVRRARLGESCVPAPHARVAPVPLARTPGVKRPIPRAAVAAGILLLIGSAFLLPGVRRWAGDLLHPASLAAGVEQPMPDTASSEWVEVTHWRPREWPSVVSVYGWSKGGSALVGEKDADPLEVEVPLSACALDVDLESPGGGAGLVVDLVAGPSDKGAGYRVTWEEGKLLEWKRVPDGKALGTHRVASAPATVHHLQLVIDKESNAGVDVDGALRLTGHVGGTLGSGGIRLLIRPVGGLVRITELVVRAPLPPRQAPTLDFGPTPTQPQPPQGQPMGPPPGGQMGPGPGPGGRPFQPPPRGGR